MSFCHLHNHTEYSQLDGVGTPQNYAKKAAELGFKYLAMTDHGNVDGAIQFQKACKENNIKSIIGCEMYIVPFMGAKNKGEQRGHITVLVKNESGWESLLRLLTRANLEGYYYRPRIDYDSVLESDLSGLIFMTACAGSFLRLEGGVDFLLNLIRKKAECYLEIMPHNISAQKKQHDLLNNILDKFYNEEIEPKFVATNDCHYVNRGDWKAQEILLAINRKAKWDDPDRFKFGFKGLHLRTETEMIKAFEKQNYWDDETIEEAMGNTLVIAKQCCDFVIPKQDISLPVPSYFSSRFGEVFDDDTVLENLLQNSPHVHLLVKKEYTERYNYEFEIISKKGFSRYFLIVVDLIQWCSENDVPVGPGRGSVGGSLLAYLLGITETDPIKYGLYFSRFISEDRLDYPDIDIDFADNKRHLVIEYLENTYGKYNTAGISTFLRMKDRGIIHDIGRVFEVPYPEVDQFAKSIVPFDENMDTLEKVAESEEGSEFVKKYPEVIRQAKKLKGQIRGAGQHAAAVVISKEDLRETNRCNLCMRSNRIMANWSMSDSEYCGLMKLDILGLNTLSVLAQCQKLINSPDLKLSAIPLNDNDVFKMLSKGDTAGVFQLSAVPSTKLCKEMQVHDFLDIPAILALVRPGPFYSGMTELYVKRKHGEDWEPDHPIYEEITKDTYGLLVYQEQVMAVISKLAGLPESTADKIRKIIGKKRDPEEFEKYKEMFVKGCLEQKTFSEKRAIEFWEGLLQWASYGFNKAHATEYGLISYWTAYLKYHWPAQFMAAELTYGTGKEDVAKEAQKRDIKIIPPKIGISHALEWRVENNTLFAPFVETKGIGEKQAFTCLPKKAKLSSFFDDGRGEINVTTSIAKILNNICAHDKDVIPDQEILQEYFAEGLFTLSEEDNDSDDSMPTLRRFNRPAKKNCPESPWVERKRAKFDFTDCTACQFYKEGNGPINPCPGILNAAIIGEAPGKKEDSTGKLFVGPTGDLIWSIFKQYGGFTRRSFHLTNVCKCYPYRSRTPKPVNIKACLPHLKKELKTINCKVALIFGNVGLQAFAGEKTGIINKSGNVQYLPEWDIMACWCVHPSWVLRDSRERIKVLRKGIAKFLNIIDDIPF